MNAGYRLDGVDPHVGDLPDVLRSAMAEVCVTCGRTAPFDGCEWPICPKKNEVVERVIGVGLAARLGLCGACHQNGMNPPMGDTRYCDICDRSEDAIREFHGICWLVELTELDYEI